jgi:hypothetical protein
MKTTMQTTGGRAVMAANIETTLTELLARATELSLAGVTSGERARLAQIAAVRAELARVRAGWL